MNKKGFTLVELLATIIILSIVVGIGAGTLIHSLKKAKEDTEEIFIKNIEDAIEIYLDSIVSTEQTMKFYTSASRTVCSITKKLGTSNVHPATTEIKLSDLTNKNKNPYSPLDKIVNPANKEVVCRGSDAKIKIYRDDDYVYYYFMDKNTLNCLLDKTGYITNLPCDCITNKIISGADSSLLTRCQ